MDYLSTYQNTTQSRAKEGTSHLPLPHLTKTKTTRKEKKKKKKFKFEKIILHLISILGK